MKTRALLLTLLTAVLSVTALAQAPTRAQLQKINARYLWESGGFGNVMYLPLDTAANAEVGAKAYKNGIEYTKDTLRWRPTASGGTFVGDNMANKNLDLTDNRTHNGKGYFFKLDTLAYLRYMVYRNDPFLGNKYYSMFYLDSTINGFPYRFVSALRNWDNTGDSIHTQFGANQNGVFLYNYGLNGSQSGIWEFKGNTATPNMNIQLYDGAKQSNFTFSNVTSLLPADSFRLRLPTRTSALKMIGLSAQSGDVYTPVAIDMGNFISGLHGDVSATGPGDALATLSNTGVIPGTYTNATVTVDIKGRLTSVANGSGGLLNLQQVTDNGNKTTDTIISKGVRTPLILPDTTDTDDYTFIVLPDLQGMTFQHPEQIRTITQWMRDNTATENVKAVLTLGDITEWATNTEFMRADTLFKTIDSLGLPYLPILGNHDYDGGGIFGPSYRANVSQWNTWFGVSRFTGKPWYGNAFHNNTSNHYMKFDVVDKKYLVLGLEFMPTDSALSWAQSVIDSNLDRHTIITTHGYMTAHGERSKDTSAYSESWVYNLSADNNGAELWEKFIRKNKTIDFVFAGHFVFPGGVPVGNFARMTEAGNYGNAIHQIMCNYQCIGKAGGDVNNGQGYFLKLRISPRNGMAHMSMYSSYLNQYDPARDSFYVDYPITKVEGSLTIENGLYNRGEVRVDSNLYLQKLPRNRVLITKENGRVDTIPDQAPNTFYAGPSSGGAANPTFRAITASDLPAGSSNYIINQNQAFTPQVADFNINGTGTMGYSSSPTPTKTLDINGTLGVTQGLGYPSGLVGGAGASIHLAHGNGSYGLAITRSGVNISGANLALFRTWGGNANTNAAVGAGNMIGRISWQAVASNNTTVGIASSIITYMATTGTFPDVARGYLAFCTTGDNGANTVQKMVLSPEGNVSILDNISTLNQSTGETDNSKLSIQHTLSGSDAYSGLHLKPTWNTTGAPTALKLNVTDDASDALSNLIDLQVSGSSRFKINKAGNVGIGDNTPDVKLDVETSSTGSDGIIITNTNSGAGARTLLKLQNDAGELGQLGVFSSTHATLPNYTLFEATKNFRIGTDAGVASGGTSNFEVVTGGYSSAPALTVKNTGVINGSSLAGSGTRAVVANAAGDLSTQVFVLKGSINWTPGIVAAGSSTSTTIAVTGAAVGDPVSVSKLSGQSNGEIYDGQVTAPGIVTLRVHNVSGGSANYSSASDYNVIVHKFN
jgi:hypothetical protein